MNLLSCDAINCCINFLCLDDMKSFGLVCKDFNAITTRSSTYLASILSTFYTGRPPVNEEDNQFIRLRIGHIFQDIIDKKIFIERPFLIQGKQLQDLPATIRQSSPAKLSLKLLLKISKTLTVPLSLKMKCFYLWYRLSNSQTNQVLKTQMIHGSWILQKKMKGRNNLKSNTRNLYYFLKRCQSLRR